MQYDTAHSLAAEIRQSSEWQEYHRLKEEVMGDETTAALIREYKKLQLSLQVAAMSGRQGEAEDMQRFSGITTLLFLSLIHISSWSWNSWGRSLRHWGSLSPPGACGKPLPKLPRGSGHCPWMRCYG